jgi:hypothetical protein
MTSRTLNEVELHYLRQAGAAPDGLLQMAGWFGTVPLRHLVDLGYLTFEGAGGNPYMRSYRITGAGRAAVVASRAAGVPQVEQPPTSVGAPEPSESASPQQTPSPAPIAGGTKREKRPVTLNAEPLPDVAPARKRTFQEVTPNPVTPASGESPRRSSSYVRQACCVQCGKFFPVRRSDAKTCSSTCRKAYSRRADELLKAFEEARRAVAEIGARMQKYPDLIELAARDLREIHDQAGDFLATYEEISPAR